MHTPFSGSRAPGVPFPARTGLPRPVTQGARAQAGRGSVLVRPTRQEA